MESESPLDVLSRAATMLHREETASESPYSTNHSRSLSLRCSAMEGTVGTVGKWKRERRHRGVTSPVSPPQNSQEPLDMTTTGAAASTQSRAAAQPPPSQQQQQQPKERASVIMASPPATGRASTTGGGISDTDIDEHFRRSLGKDYMNVFAPAAREPQPQTAVVDEQQTIAPQQQQRQRQQQQQPQQQQQRSADLLHDNAELSVDDHFAKALGDTWIKLQKEEYQKKRKETENGRQKLNVYA